MLAPLASVSSLGLSVASLCAAVARAVLQPARQAGEERPRSQLGGGRRLHSRQDPHHLSSLSG